MWNALKSDFTEFVSTVTEDTSNVLSRLDSEAGDNEDDDASGEGQGMDPEGGEEEKSDLDVVDHHELAEIMKLLRDHPGTYTEPLTDEDDKEAVEEYLANFTSIEAMTDDIAEVLKTHEETVKKHFEELCPTEVSYEEFWKRYFFRCDEKRIARQLREETDRARQARAEAIEAGVKSVTNFFGGLGKAVTNTIAPENPNKEHHFFGGAGGRPPFVMNTAVDESGEDDDDFQEDEELGWDDDDDDDELEFNAPPSGNASGTVEFTDKVAEDLKEKLKQAIEERDQIQQTVHLQAEQIKSLTNKLEGGDAAKEENGSELQKLKMELFEKDSEIAALKASASDDSESAPDDVATLARQLGRLPPDQLAQLKLEVFGPEPPSDAGGGEEKTAALEEQIQQLTKALESKEEFLKAAQEELATVSKDLEKTNSQLGSDQMNAQKASAAKTALEQELKSSHMSLQAKDEEIEQLKRNTLSAQEESAAQLSSLKQQLSASEQESASLAAQLREAQDQLKQTETALKQKEAELALAKQTGPTPSTPDSLSTGVQVDTPAFHTPAIVAPIATKLDLGESDRVSEGSDWGDDWD